MSALAMTSGGTPARGPHPRRLRAVPDSSLADVRDLSTAPSAVRRLVAGVCAVVVATGVAAGAGVAARPDPYAGPTFTHSVAAGESVWGLAASLGSPRPLEQVVADIEQLNDLDGGLVAGQEISLPVE